MAFLEGEDYRPWVAAQVSTLAMWDETAAAPADWLPEGLSAIENVLNPQNLLILFKKPDGKILHAYMPENQCFLPMYLIWV